MSAPRWAAGGAPQPLRSPRCCLRLPLSFTPTSRTRHHSSRPAAAFVADCQQQALKVEQLRSAEVREQSDRRPIGRLADERLSALRLARRRSISFSFFATPFRRPQQSHAQLLTQSARADAHETGVDHDVAAAKHWRAATRGPNDAAACALATSCSPWAATVHPPTDVTPSDNIVTAQGGSR
jgi:hypothetical protein